MYNTTVIFNDVLNPVSDNIADNLVNKIDDRIVLVYDESKQKNLSYLIQNKDPKVYEGVLDYCEVMNVSHLFLSFLYFPEYLLAELSRRKNLKTKISFVFDWRLFRISKTRTNVMKKLIKKKNIAKVIVHGNIPFYDRERKAIINDERISLKKIYEAYIPIFYETEKIKNKDALEKLGLDKNKFWLLYFGRMFYGRGLDRIIKVMDNSFIKEKDINLLVVSQSEHLNYDLDLQYAFDKNILPIHFNANLVSSGKKYYSSSLIKIK